jgi:hypothetical protein
MPVLSWSATATAGQRLNVVLLLKPPIMWVNGDGEATFNRFNGFQRGLR